MENIEKPGRKPMTQEERLQLAAKLDKELDAFIESLPRKKYEDGWPEDRWEEEMEKHPFFMKEPPKPGQELHPLYEGLQALKYDPDENEPEDLATSYKDDGNFNFKHKNYRLAIVAYTEGIKIKFENPELRSSLYNNRSAAHYFLKNFRSALRDCELALKIKPDYCKVQIRAANCCYEIKQFQKCIEHCDTILEKEKENEIVLELRKKCVINLKLKERDERKKEAEIRKKLKEDEALINMIQKKGYKIEGENITLEKLEPHFPQLMHNRVFFDESGYLVWPVVLIYPEYKVMDYIQQFSETQTLFEQLSQVYEVIPDWDEEKKYKVDQLNVYFETPKKKIIKIDIGNKLGDILKLDGFIIKGGTPAFIILARESAAEKRFLAEY